MPIVTVYVTRTDDPEATTLLRRLRHQGHNSLEGVAIERVYRLEYEAERGLDLDALLPLLVSPVFESYATVSQLDPHAGPIVEVGYRAAVTDPETPSILAGARVLGQDGLIWARLALRYQLAGVTESEANDIARAALFNPVVQEIVEPGRRFDTLRPSGEPDPVRSISLVGLSDDDLTRLSRDSSWYAPLAQLQVLQEYEARIGRPLTDAEIEIVVQSWSDHCYHTTWKSLGLLRTLMEATRKIGHPAVVSVFADNAGGMLLDDEWVVTLKGETHNFPTFIAPFGGVATKHGGVIRDSIGFGRGGFAIGGSTIMGTMDPRLPAADLPSGALDPGYVVRESIRATASYCNPMGIPMMYSVYRSHPNYPKGLALGHSMGLIPRRYALKEVPRPGDILLLIGGQTGRDGLHGATASSTQMTGETIHKEAAAVQIGHPITERKFMEAVPVLRDADCIRSITDLGAGGISCAVGEMGAETGVRIDLDHVPLKDASLAPWEILLSESQERMLVAVPPEKLELARDILARYDVEASVIGHFTGDLRYEVTRHGEKVVDLDMLFLWRACPIEPAEVAEPARHKLQPTPAPPEIDDLPNYVARVLAHYHCCDQSPAGFQFDCTVQGRTVIGPYGGKTGKMPTGVYVSAPVRGKRVGVASTVAFNPFYGELSPAGLARTMILEAVARAVAVGADPGNIALCDNFYTPRSTPQVNRALVEMVEAIADLSVRLGMPFISGKDSSSGTFLSADGRVVDAPLTLVIATLARVPDVTRVVRKELRVAGNRLVLLGHLDPNRLGGSVYLDCRGTRGDGLHDPGQDGAAAFLPIWERLFSVYQRTDSPILAAAAIGEGGILVRLFEMAYGGGLGVRLDLDSFGDARWDGILFAEATGALLLEVAADVNPGELFDGLPWREIGCVQAAQETPRCTPIAAHETASWCTEPVSGPESFGVPSIDIVRGSSKVASLAIADLVRAWEATFAEVTL